jgi:hypothetical protein
MEEGPGHGRNGQRLVGWIPLGGIVGLAAGFLYGGDYVLPGLAIGLAAGLGIFWGLRRRLPR